MNYSQVFYLLSLSLQVSGALILIIFCWGNTERRVLNTIYSANANVHREDDDTVIISREKLVRAYENVLQNRTAFILIAIGYLISLFGSNEGICAWVGLVIVLIVSAILVTISVMTVRFIAKVCNRKDKVYPYEELCSKLDNDVVTNAIQSEIDEIFL
jgi:hypothetical protein